jgi:3-oxo-5-alpha-steroid 4-dehydrogenase 1
MHYTLDSLYRMLLFAELAFAIIVFILLMFVSAPYGKHYRKGWGITLDSRSAWLISEIPAVTVIALIAMLWRHNLSWMTLLFLVFWETHYVYRTFFFSLQLRGSRRSFPLLLVVLAFVFNCMNGYINGYYLFGSAPAYDFHWLWSPQFVIGTLLFVGGLITHIHADAAIRALRSPSDTSYRTPTGGLFDYITNPNYFGEIIQWIGWALVTFSLAGLAFAIFTAANLLPRAISNHRWYRERFPVYARDTKILIPFVF